MLHTRFAGTGRASDRDPAHPAPGGGLGVRGLSRRGDAAEREAEDLADRALGVSAAERAASPGAPGPIDSRPGGAVTPPAGRGLTSAERERFEPSLGGADFSRVRVHDDHQARQAAHDAGALAFAVGDRVVWGASAAPDSEVGRPILTHELAHIAAGHTAAAPGTIFRQEAPDAAVLPTQEQQERIVEIYNPQQSQGQTPEVADPAAFKAAMVALGATLRAASLPSAQAVQASPVVLSETDLTDVTAIAEEEVRRDVGEALPPGADTAAVRSRIQYIPTDPGTAPAAGEATLSADELARLDLSIVRVKISQSAAAQTLIDDHNVLTGGRDSALFEEVLTAIVAAAPADWRTIALSARGFNSRTATLVQRRIVQESGESVSDARRRGRWLNLGTSIHEMLHAVTHPTFSTTVRGLERDDFAVEGFTEFFTRRIYADVVSRVASDPALRLRIEGAPGPAITPPPRTSYSAFFATTNTIFSLLNSNLENMRQAYFNGRVEFIGLGSWNEIRAGLPTERGSLIGAAVLLESVGGSLQGRPLVRASYGHLLWGRSGSFQVDLRGGGGITYMSEGQRLGIGPEASLTLRGSHLFVSGGALVQGSAAVSGPAELNLDTLLRIEAGAQIGRFQVGPTLELLVPITNRDAADRGNRVFFGLGASFVFGK
jgi:hypothetical protein